MEIRKIRGKKAQIEANTLIYLLIAAAILIFAFLLIFDVGGIRSKLIGSVGKSNVDDVTRNCNLFCSQNSKANYEARQDVILADTAKTKLSASCKELEGTRENGCLISGAGSVDVSNIKVTAQSECTKPAWKKEGSLVSGCYIVGANPAVPINGIAFSDCKAALNTVGKCMVGQTEIPNKDSNTCSASVSWNAGGNCIMGKTTAIAGVGSEIECTKITTTWIGAFSQPIITNSCPNFA